MWNLTCRQILESSITISALLDDILIINDQTEQEWNISRKELLEIVEVGILTEDDIEQATSAIFNPVS